MLYKEEKLFKSVDKFSAICTVTLFDILYNFAYYHILKDKMFLDTIWNNRSTEPVWFRLIRGFFAITLTGIIIYYAIVQYQKIGTEASIAVKFERINGYKLNMSICTGISNGINNVKFSVFSEYDYGVLTLTNDTVNHQNVSFSSFGLSNFHSWLNITTNINNNINNETISHDFSDPYCNPYTIPNNLLSLNFESFQYLFSSKSDLDYSNYNIIDTSHFSLYLGRAYFIHHKPTMVDYNGVELNLQLEQLPIQLESNEVRLRISPDILLSKPANARFVRFESTRIFGFTDLISNLGGFYGAIAGLFYLFFGMQRLEPWGLAQKYLFSCTHCRKSLKRNFARKYVSSAGIPLVEKVDKRPEGSSLEQRVQILETLLRDYYLDDYYLKKVKYVRVNHKRFLKKYEEINRQDNEDTENTESTELDASLV
ncbi:unnamed protein product [Rhizophagus irregularis]|uniref:Uncharacterized protein n=4 Tax=Rhizophagus irregularis TaxID=588596 RepID=A0A915ZP02_9GLOM|nr:hypothetical protein GLOIN_2v1873134 [Rhizophagus irregularis DAOM 181602=DAOM 197198]CAB4484990.1 unnamed protein product [Rhizophagus irregularis]POG75009.1 hypothetical protein GLOIN_2v1873134 [Rhizophagus irregularis DAOM 181602=DAOM 197198]CAB5196124.1 unnamed protein product [Rhizophagus irregularis]CAB5385277.1 unnamed protein product [Rhizophagus irregularis]GBC53728.1 hypothetical protein GLOIN_2v1873134 [Rhizophagus irregularis DAOM 181602=DAOM 197198]|eukprot:XP_025181875.1 hypothetical protein GLOIN_2v1873134 [Rhizophagus irregularis DAOM 181602=DAOM 197198]